MHHYFIWLDFNGRHRLSSNWILLMVILFFSSCDHHVASNQESMVKYHGALKQMMRKGDISSKVKLTDLEQIPNLYALGAVSELKGEILVLNDQVMVSSVENGTLIQSDSYNHEATLLVYASVKDWKNIAIPESVTSQKQLEKFILENISENGFDKDQAIPFMIIGRIDSLAWHVIDWPEGDNEHSHKKHIESGLSGTLKNEDIVALGFYSKKHRGIFTHHTSNTHIHFKTEDNRLSGHVDQISLGQKAILRIPKPTI